MTGVPEEITVTEAAKLPAEWQWVDVRTPEERAEGYIRADSVHIELTELAARAGELDRERPVVVYCRSGARSAMAVAALRAGGYEATNLAGGILAWDEARLPVATDG
jgi:rhodanese-related sulfurtransferase